MSYKSIYIWLFLYLYGVVPVLSLNAEKNLVLFEYPTSAMIASIGISVSVRNDFALSIRHWVRYSVNVTPVNFLNALLKYAGV